MRVPYHFPCRLACHETSCVLQSRAVYMALTSSIGHWKTQMCMLLRSLSASALTLPLSLAATALEQHTANLSKTTAIYI